MPYRISQPGSITVECDTTDEVVALSNHLSANLIHPTLAAETPSFVGTDSSAPALTPKESAKLDRKLGQAAMLQAGIAPIKAKPAKASVPVEANRANKGTFSFIKNLDLNKSKRVKGFTTAQISSAITRARSGTTKDFEYEVVNDTTIKVKRTA